MSMLILNVIHEPVYAPAWHKQACADNCRIPRGVIGCLSSLEFFFKAKGSAAALEEEECLLSRKTPPPPPDKRGFESCRRGFLWGFLLGVWGGLGPKPGASRPLESFLDLPSPLSDAGKN